MRISRAAELAGVPTHVLRHWEDEGLLRPKRRAGNQRDYTQDQVDQALIIRRLRLAGVGIPTLRQLLTASAAEREAILASVAERLEQESAQTYSAAAFLRHTTSCSHAVIEECPKCSRYAHGGPGVNSPAPGAMPGSPALGLRRDEAVLTGRPSTTE